MPAPGTLAQGCAPTQNNARRSAVPRSIERRSPPASPANNMMPSESIQGCMSGQAPACGHGELYVSPVIISDED